MVSKQLYTRVCRPIAWLDEFIETALMAVTWYDLKWCAYHMTSTGHVTFNTSHAMGYVTSWQANHVLQMKTFTLLV